MLELQQQYFWLGLGYTALYLILGPFTGDFGITDIKITWKVLSVIALFSMFAKIITLTPIYRNLHVFVKNSIGFVLFAIFLLGVVAYTAQMNAKYVKKQKGSADTSLIYNDASRFYPNSFTYFVGKTNNYIFLFHEKDSITEIIPMSDVKRIFYNHKRKTGNP